MEDRVCSDHRGRSDHDATLLEDLGLPAVNFPPSAAENGNLNSLIHFRSHSPHMQSTRRAAASRSPAAVDASTLLFQREALSAPAELERVSGAHWDPVFADGLALCDEHGLFQCVATSRAPALPDPQSSSLELVSHNFLCAFTRVCHICAGISTARLPTSTRSFSACCKSHTMQGCVL